MVMTCLLMMEKVYRLVSLVVDNRLNPGEVGLMLIYLVPQVLVITLPLSVVGAVFVTVIRQSMDSEVISLRASGRSLFNYALPFVVFGLLITVFSSSITMWLAPLASRKYQDLQVEMVRWRAEEKIQPGSYNFDFGNKVIRVGGRSKENGLEEVFIADRKQTPSSPVIIANQGWIEVDENERQVIFRLQSGHVLSPGESGDNFREVKFEALRYVLDYAPATRIRLRKQSVRSWSELRADLEGATRSNARRNILLEMYKRMTLPWACMALALAALPMAIMDPRSGRGAGYVRAVFLIGGYFVAWAAFKDLVASGRASANALWLPVLLITLYGILRLWQINADLESVWGILRRPAGRASNVKNERKKQ